MTLVFLMFFFFISNSMTEVYAADRKASDKNKVRVWFSSEKDPASRTWYDGPQEVKYALDEQTPLTLTKRRLLTPPPCILIRRAAIKVC